MSQSEGQRGGTGAGVRRVIWASYVIAWTAALVVPIPGDTTWQVEALGGVFDLKYLLGKALHIGAYAVLAGLTGWLQAPARWRLALLFFVMAHAPATELIQLHVAERTGTLEDVAFDHCGVGLGLLLTWRWWSEPPREK